MKDATSQRKLRRSLKANFGGDSGSAYMSPDGARAFVGMAPHDNQGKKPKLAALQSEPRSFLGGLYRSVHFLRHCHVPSNFVSEYSPVGIYDFYSSDVRAPNQGASFAVGFGRGAPSAATLQQRHRRRFELRASRARRLPAYSGVVNAGWATLPTGEFLQ
jgi:hypothetical protein